MLRWLVDTTSKMNLALKKPNAHGAEMNLNKTLLSKRNDINAHCAEINLIIASKVTGTINQADRNTISSYN